MRPSEALAAFRTARARRESPDRAATVHLEEPRATRLDADDPASPWATLEALYERCARHGTLADMRDLERIRIRRDALSNGNRMTDEAVDAALVQSPGKHPGVTPIADAAERDAVNAALAAARAAYRSRVRGAFEEAIPSGAAAATWEQALLDSMRTAPRPDQLRALVLLTVLAHMYVNTSVYSDTSDEKEAPPTVLMRVWQAVARWTKSAAPHQPVGSIYELAQLNVRRVGTHASGDWPSFIDGLCTTLRDSIVQRTLVQDAVERLDLLFPFIQMQQDDGTWVSDRLERTTWNLIFLMSLTGDRGVRPVFEWLADHGEALLAWWRRQSRRVEPDRPLFTAGVREALHAALEEAARWTRVMGSLFSLLNARNDHTPTHWFRFVRHWPDWNIETEVQAELVTGFNGGQLQALHALDDLFLHKRGSQIAVEMQYQERYLAEDDTVQLHSLQDLMAVLRVPWRYYVELDPETIGRFNSVVWEIFSFRVSHTSKAWLVMKEGENPSTGGMFEDEDHKTDRAVGERRETLGPDSPQHLHFINAMVPRMLETSAGLIREDDVAGRYWHWSVTLQQNGESATDPHRRVKGFARAVYTQRRAVEAGQSGFQAERAGGGDFGGLTQKMGADKWLTHLRTYDPRWTGEVQKGVLLSPSVTLERALLLRRVEMFSSLDEVLLAEIAAFLEPLHLAEGETLFEEGDAGDAMYIVAEGCLQIVRGGVPLVDRGAMEIVGEMAVLDPAPRSASAVAIEDTRLLRLEDEHLYTLMADHPAINRGVIRTLCQRLR